MSNNSISIDKFNEESDENDAFCFDVILYDDLKKEKVSQIWILRQYFDKTFERVQKEFNKGKEFIILVHQKFDEEKSLMIQEKSKISLLKNLSDEENKKFNIRPNMIFVTEKKKNYQRLKKYDNISGTWLSFPEWQEKKNLGSESGYSEFYSNDFERITQRINEEATKRLKNIVFGLENKKEILKEKEEEKNEEIKYFYEERKLLLERLNSLDIIIQNYEKTKK